MSLAQSNLSPSKVSSKFSSPAKMTSIFAKTKLKTKTLIKNLKEQNSAQDSGLWHPSQERFARLPGEVAGVNEPEVVPPSTPVAKMHPSSSKSSILESVKEHPSSSESSILDSLQPAGPAFVRSA